MANFLVIAVILLACGLAVRSLWKDKKNGGGCSGNCGSCGGCGGSHKNCESEDSPSAE